MQDIIGYVLIYAIAAFIVLSLMYYYFKLIIKHAIIDAYKEIKGIKVSDPKYEVKED